MSNDSLPPTELSPRKQEIRALYDRYAGERDKWVDRNLGFYAAEWRYMKFLVPEGARILELGCGDGRLLSLLNPSVGVGLDISPRMIEEAKKHHPQFRFVVGDAEDPAAYTDLGGPFDVIILSDTIGMLEDCQGTIERLHALSTRETRIIIAYYNQLWRPILWLAEKLGRKMPEPKKNWLSMNDLKEIVGLADCDVIKREWRQLIPIHLFGLGRLINSYIASLPLLRRLCLRNYVVARPVRDITLDRPSASVIIPCRNEQGNIEAAVKRLPRFCPDVEIVFVEGHSRDGTYEECLRIRALYPDKDIKVIQQDGIGKGDAVRKGFATARGDILIILDADLTVPPEAVPKFYDVLVKGKGDFVNGTRLVYPMESGAMRFLNYLANRAFAIVFSWLLNQRFTDTLCGTKALRKEHYRRLDIARSYFGKLDPFGDFDLIFGAAKLNLKIVEIPVLYRERHYGTTQISRFRHGWLLFRMIFFAFRKLKMI